jgi:hypothetical protein
MLSKSSIPKTSIVEGLVESRNRQEKSLTAVRKLTEPKKSMANVSSTSSIEKVDQESTRCMSPKSKKELDQRASMTAHKRHKTPKGATEVLFHNYSQFKTRRNAQESF